MNTDQWEADDRAVQDRLEGEALARVGAVLDERGYFRFADNATDADKEMAAHYVERHMSRNRGNLRASQCGLLAALRR